MVLIAKDNFLWYKPGQALLDKDVPSYNQVPTWKDHFEDSESVKKEKVELDLNNDGLVDKEDAKIASSVLNQIKRNKKNKRRKGN